MSSNYYRLGMKTRCSLSCLNLCYVLRRLRATVNTLLIPSRNYHTEVSESVIPVPCSRPILYLSESLPIYVHLFLLLLCPSLRVVDRSR